MFRLSDAKRVRPSEQLEVLRPHAQPLTAINDDVAACSARQLCVAVDDALRAVVVRLSL